MGWWRPREVSGPTRLSHSRGRCHSAAKVSASRTDCITRPRGEGLGLVENWRLKVFCPAFLQKSGRGPGAAPLAARRSARNAPCAHKAQEGVKGGTLAGGPPFAGGPRRPQLALGRHYSGEHTPPPAPQELRRHAKKGPPLRGPFAFPRFLSKPRQARQSFTSCRRYGRRRRRDRGRCSRGRSGTRPCPRRRYPRPGARPACAPRPRERL